MSAGAQQLDQKSGPHTQTLGPWDLTAPDSAGLIAGGGSSWGWLNVANAAVSESQAMTSSPIEDQAYANADAGTMLEVGFSGGVTNVAGPDLVMLDAAFDYGLYMIRSDYDGFAAGFTVDINNGVVASTEAYYYEMNGSGPFTANVIGVEVDLDSLGVPAGAVVHTLRFECLNAACDPVTLAALQTGFTLSVDNLIAGQMATASATGGTPGGLIGIGMSRVGAGPSMINAGPCGMVSVELSFPIQVLELSNADANGDLSVSGMVPANAAGLTLYFHALDFGSCTLSNAVTEVIL